MRPDDRYRLGAAVKQLIKLLNAIKIQIDAIAENTKPSNKSEKPQEPPPIRVVPQLPEAITEYYETGQHRHARANWWRLGNFALAVLSFAALVWYACTTYRQWRTMDKTLRETTKNFRIDERAWMGFSFVGGNITFTRGRSFLVPTELINTGKTPAHKISGHIVVRVVAKGESLDFDYTPGHGNTAYVINAGTIFPNGNIKESFEALVHGKKEALVLTKSIMDDILNTRAFVVVYGDIVYSDIFGIQHWTHYCRYVTAPSLISEQCTEYNDADNNN